MDFESKSVPYRLVQPFIPPLHERLGSGHFTILKQDTQDVLKDSTHVFLQNSIYYYHSLVFLFIGFLLLSSTDMLPLSQSSHFSLSNGFLRSCLAWIFLPTGWFFLSCIIWLAGQMRKSLLPRRTAIASLFAALAGCITYIFISFLMPKPFASQPAILPYCAIASSLAASMVYLFAWKYLGLPIVSFGWSICIFIPLFHPLSPAHLLLGIGSGIFIGCILGSQFYRKAKSSPQKNLHLPHCVGWLPSSIQIRAIKAVGNDILEEIRSDLSLLFVRALTLCRKYGYIIFHGSSFILIVSIIGFQHDARLIGWFQFPQMGFLHEVARFFSHWGDFPTGCLLFCLVCWITGYVRRKRMWRQIAIACLLASLLAGATTQITKHVVGRARPYTEQQQGFYFLHPSASFHSFPSGHTASSVALATAVAVIAPEFSFPAIIWGGGVGWSRIQMNSHFPTDVFAGACIGILFGALFGSAVQRQHYSLRKTVSNLTQLARARLSPE
ncbi:phosphatase PAP2 family protein [bacterium]|nr:phosphatase PAP2 family protein [bacterium]